MFKQCSVRWLSGLPVRPLLCSGLALLGVVQQTSLVASMIKTSNVIYFHVYEHNPNHKSNISLDNLT